MSTIDEVITFLKDGKWHDIQEVTEAVVMPKPRTEMVISFLSEYDFIQQESGKRIKLKASMLEFIEGIQRLEKNGL